MTSPAPLPASAKNAALWVLITLQAVMLASMFAELAPHPPRTIPLFALAPFLGVAIAAAIASLQMGSSLAGRALAVIAALLASVSFGPHKYIDPAFGEIWPAVITAQLAIVTILYQVFVAARKGAEA
ncbi:hypothetical protein J7443_22950 [Tropicibacter sp. R15_0]|uniref:hypothetical protein n=1 Tax=Tropicibacter sp. R15_0 TaxID=2821101 RepID=UPI001ADC7D68|nr:hypothetical protein [Tropicibacter sp. R15_0]MBO9468102.1 hypothetical protein [Tropicibacter sp. R15_0]